MDMHISKIDDAGTPMNMWVFEGSGLGSAPGWSVLHGLEDGQHLAAALTVSANVTLPSGATSGSAGALIENQASQGGTGVVIKMKADGTIPWHKEFASTAGSSVSGVDGDAQGNIFVYYTTCGTCRAAEPCRANAPALRAEPLARGADDRAPRCRCVVSALCQLVRAGHRSLRTANGPERAHLHQVAREAQFCGWVRSASVTARAGAARRARGVP